MKSWISFLLPVDEYKRKKLLYFISEGSVILFLFLAFIFVSSYFSLFQIDLEFALFIAMSVFIMYVFFRYILSGMEFTEIATATSYKKKLKNILRKTTYFVIMFMLLYFILVVGVPSNINDWVEVIVFPFVVGFFWFLFNYISLKKSYKKNKELL